MIIIRTGSTHPDAALGDCIMLRYEWSDSRIELDASAVMTIHKLDRIQAELLRDTLSRLIEYQKEDELRGSNTVLPEGHREEVSGSVPEASKEPL